MFNDLLFLYNFYRCFYFNLLAGPGLPPPLFQSSMYPLFLLIFILLKSSTQNDVYLCIFINAFSILCMYDMLSVSFICLVMNFT